MRYLAFAALALLAACTQAPPPDPNKVESYAVRLAVTPAEGASEQRIALPASALSALQSPDLADLRLFDGTGRPLPMALAQTHMIEEQQGSDVPVYPVVGPAAPGTTGVALTIGPDNVARVSGIAAGAGEERARAALLDTRKIEDPAVAISLDAELPLNQPVTLSLESSASLARWEPLGEKVLFRTDATGGQLEPGRIALPGVALKDRYLRVTWGEAKGVAVNAARVVTAKTGALPRIVVAAGAPKLVRPREVRFSLPATDPNGPLVAIRIDPAKGEGVLPVRLSARYDEEAPWSPLAATTLRDPGSPSNVIELAGSASAEYQLKVDDRTPGFAAPPKVELQFKPVELAAQFNGKPPFTLAAGLKGAPSTLLEAGDIAPTGTAALATARIDAGSPPRVEIEPAATSGLLSQQKTLLWVVLLAGVAILGFAVIRLMRGSRGGDPE
jgi:hypothetical protein